MKKIFLLSIVFLGFFVWYYLKYPLTSSVTIRNQKIFVEMAVTESEKRNGLSSRKNLPHNQGMLFLMGEPAYHGFWMKDMKFPLDFIWIRDKAVVDITENVPHPVDGNPPANIKPRDPADKVLEVNAGIIKQLEIQVGDIVNFNR